MDFVAGRYQLIEEVGHGGSARVFRCKHLTTERIVALKLLHGYLNASELQRFKNEAQMLSALSHPNIVQVFGFGLTHDQLPYIEMEFLEGIDLSRRLKEGPLTQRQFVQVFEQLLAALSCLHSHGLVHRDVKPSNVMLRLDEDGSVQSKLFDFGIAKRLDCEQNLTRSGEITGTPAYMSPEQWKGEVVDARSDLYSVGCMMYECATGALPYDGNSAKAFLPHSKDGLFLMPAALQSLLPKLLHLDPNLRFSSADEVLSELRKLDLSSSEAFEARGRDFWQLSSVRVRIVALVAAIAIIGAGASLVSVSQHVNVDTQSLPIDINSKVSWLRRENRLQEAREALIVYVKSGHARSLSETTHQLAAELYADAVNRKQYEEALALSDSAISSGTRTFWLDWVKRKLNVENICGKYSIQSLELAEKALLLASAKEPTSAESELKIAKARIAIFLDRADACKFYEEALAAVRKDFSTKDPRRWSSVREFFEWLCVYEPKDRNLITNALDEAIIELTSFLKTDTTPNWTELVNFLHTYSSIESAKDATKLNETLSQELARHTQFAPEEIQVDLALLSARIGARRSLKNAFMKLRAIQSGPLYPKLAMEKKIQIEQLLCEFSENPDDRIKYARQACKLAQQNGIDKKTTLSATWTLADTLAQDALTTESIGLYQRTVEQAQALHTSATNQVEKEYFRRFLVSIAPAFAQRCIDCGNLGLARTQLELMERYARTHSTESADLACMWSRFVAKEIELQKRSRS